ncbi:hypothetical protein [uncultured Photobacterium sp.]|uniref:hypothetical protein n=1 Tax=uncultured Photobacterium sp. TaxID=173973 RepID=UPI00260AF7E4|nr:hypothetical protein [uncultured Photobacterium sp.]
MTTLPALVYQYLLLMIHPVASIEAYICHSPAHMASSGGITDWLLSFINKKGDQPAAFFARISLLAFCDSPRCRRTPTSPHATSLKTSRTQNILSGCCAWGERDFMD